MFSTLGNIKLSLCVPVFILKLFIPSYNILLSNLNCNISKPTVLKFLSANSFASFRLSNYPSISSYFSYISFIFFCRF